MQSQVTIFDHPLISHKTSILRDVNTGSKEFRELVEEVSKLLGYEALRDLQTEFVEIKTPITTTKAKMLSGKKIAIIPILRAGLGMVGGFLDLLPTARVGHIGLYRDQSTMEPKEYYCKLPEGISDKIAIILDPMLATGGSASAAVQLIKDKGCKNIKFVSIIASPEGVKKLTEDHPDIQIYIGCIDDKLNEYGYIVPGFGDAGDRMFGTK